LAQLGALEIVSRVAGGFETFGKVLRAGRELRCGPNAAQRARHGTTVHVSEFAVAQPVRRRALLEEAARGSLAEGIRRSLLALLLPWPGVELVLKDATPAGAGRATLLHLERVSHRGRVAYVASALA
jgi:DNA mismatch repair ATPase MutL